MSHDSFSWSYGYDPIPKTITELRDKLIQNSKRNKVWEVPEHHHHKCEYNFVIVTQVGNHLVCGVVDCYCRTCDCIIELKHNVKQAKWYEALRQCKWYIILFRAAFGRSPKKAVVYDAADDKTTVVYSIVVDVIPVMIEWIKQQLGGDLPQVYIIKNLMRHIEKVQERYKSDEVFREYVKTDVQKAIDDYMKSDDINRNRGIVEMKAENRKNDNVSKRMGLPPPLAPHVQDSVPDVWDLTSQLTININ
jgi:hypothetical protein